METAASSAAAAEEAAVAAAANMAILPAKAQIPKIHFPENAVREFHHLLGVSSMAKRQPAINYPGKPESVFIAAPQLSMTNTC